MTSAIGALTPGLEMPSPGNRQADAENQREAWLRQMELSQIAMLQQTGTQHAQVAAQDAALADLLPVHPILAQAQTASAQDQDEKAGDDSGSQAVPQAAAYQPATTAGDGAASHAAAGGANAASGQASTKTAAMRAENAAMGPAVSAQREAQTGETAAAIPSAAVVPSAATTAATSASVAAALAVTSAGAATALEAAQETVLQPSPATTPVAVLRSGAGVASAATDAGTGEATETASGTPRRPGAAAGDDGESWQKRMIHVSQDGQDVSLSIRDSALLPGQSEQIVFRLAGDMAQTGLRVRNAIVNGKTILKSNRADAATAAAGHADIDPADLHGSDTYTTTQDTREQ